MSQKKQTNTEMNHHLNIRLDRARSWFAKAENAEDEYTRFIALWIAFNALYAIKKNQEETERSLIEINHFLTAIARLDVGRMIAKKLWEKNEEIRIILNDENCFQYYWENITKKSNKELRSYHRKKNSEYYRNFQNLHFAPKSKESTQQSERGERYALIGLFERIYTLRNRIFHGGISYFEQEQQTLKNINTVLRLLLPIIFFIMENNMTMDWGQPFYCA